MPEQSREVYKETKSLDVAFLQCGSFKAINNKVMIIENKISSSKPGGEFFPILGL